MEEKKKKKKNSLVFKYNKNRNWKDSLTAGIYYIISAAVVPFNLVCAAHILFNFKTIISCLFLKFL